MQSHAPWRTAFERAAALGLKVSVIDPTGFCLALANWSDSTLQPVEAVCGHNWREFIAVEDLPRLLAWFRAHLPGQPITYRALGADAGAPATLRVALVKVWVGSAWLVVGEAELVALIPAEPVGPSPA